MHTCNMAMQHSCATLPLEQWTLQQLHPYSANNSTTFADWNLILPPVAECCVALVCRVVTSLFHATLGAAEKGLCWLDDTPTAGAGLAILLRCHLLQQGLHQADVPCRVIRQDIVVTQVAGGRAQAYVQERRSDLQYLPMDMSEIDLHCNRMLQSMPAF